MIDGFFQIGVLLDVGAHLGVCFIETLVMQMYLEKPFCMETIYPPARLYLQQTQT